jgi:DNA polymerase III alpha subunit
VKQRTGFSFRTAFGHLPEVMAVTPWEGFAPITDRASTFGFNRWTKLAKKEGRRPVYGVELAVTPSINEKKPQRSYMTFVAMDSLAPIHELLERATAQFRYEPLLTYEDVNAIDPARVAVLLGRKPMTDKLVLREGLYLDASPATPLPIIEWAGASGIPIIASSDNVYPCADDYQAYEILCGRGASGQTYPQHILSRDEWLMAMGNRTDWWDASLALMDRCTAALRPAEMMHPAKPQTLEAMCRDGAAKLGCDLTNPVYEARLQRELGLIAQKEFEDYFYIIADLVQYAKQHMFVGPARGSSCGSLVCWLLGITTIDPIPHGLLFERFIDITRTDLPDIDIDFNDVRRHKVFDYLKQKYGSSHVARLGTVAMYKPRSAINETGAALKVPKWRVDQFTAGIIERSGGDSRAMQGVEDTFADTEIGQKLLADYPELGIAMRLEGHPRHYSQHAAGVVVTQDPTAEYVASDARTGATHCDKKDAEDLNLLKIDALGLTQLGVFEHCLELIGKPREWLINYPLDDPKAWEVLNQQRWSGIFQWNGHALQSLTQQFTVTEFEDMVSITALARPGPLSSGGATQWIDRKNGREAVTYPHEVFRPSLESSMGIVIYQEQVMQLGREVGGLTWDDVTALRKAMSKSLGKEFFDQFGDRFKAGAVANGVPRDILDKVWDDLCQYGAWAFNRSHSVAYGMVSYWCCVLKAHHPVEFAAATLTAEADPSKQLKVLREMAREGVEYVAVDPEHSTDKWEVHGGKLVGPLTGVKGLGPKLLREVLQAREHGLPMPKRAAKLLASPATTIDDLYPVASRIAKLVPDFMEAGIITPPKNLVDIQPSGREDEHVVIVKVQEINLRDHNELGNVIKRGYKMTGQTQFVNLVLEDDTDRMLARIDRYAFDKVGRSVVEIGAPGKALWVMKGRMATDFRLINIKRAKFLGMME